MQQKLTVAYVVVVSTATVEPMEENKEKEENEEKEDIEEGSSTEDLVPKQVPAT